jgi:Mg2+ and Co2+ transporter CorA
MNVDFPGFGSAAAYWLILGAMGGVLVGVVLFFRWRRFF